MTKEKECLIFMGLFLIVASSIPPSDAQMSHAVPKPDLHQRILEGEDMTYVIIFGLIGLPITGYLFWRWTRK